jgi:hypothetical protein
MITARAISFRVKPQVSPQRLSGAWVPEFRRVIPRFGGIATDLAPKFDHIGEDIGLNSRSN